jgi:hypothetical protein
MRDMMTCFSYKKLDRTYIQKSRIFSKNYKNYLVWTKKLIGKRGI